MALATGILCPRLSHAQGGAEVRRRFVLAEAVPCEPVHRKRRAGRPMTARLGGVPQKFRRALIVNVLAPVTVSDC